jgi:hypothetical protein
MYIYKCICYIIYVQIKYVHKIIESSGVNMPSLTSIYIHMYIPTSCTYVYKYRCIRIYVWLCIFCLYVKECMYVQISKCIYEYIYMWISPDPFHYYRGIRGTGKWFRTWHNPPCSIHFNIYLYIFTYVNNFLYKRGIRTWSQASNNPPFICTYIYIYMYLHIHILTPIGPFLGHSSHRWGDIPELYTT